MPTWITPMTIRGYCSVKAAPSAVAANRLLAEKLPSDTVRIRPAYRRTLGRNPTSLEREIILEFLRQERDLQKAWTQILHGLYSSLDFRYLN